MLDVHIQAMDNILDEMKNGWAFDGKVPSWASFRLPGAGDDFGVWFCQYYYVTSFVLISKKLHQVNEKFGVDFCKTLQQIPSH